MKTQIHYGNIARSRELDELVHRELKKLEPLICGSAVAEVWLKNHTNIERRGKSMFSTSIKLKRSRRRVFFVHKTRPNFFNGIRRAVESLRNALRKEKQR